jgi:SAM-dependent methyltransferase
MFHRVTAAGGTPAFWEETWRDGDAVASARFCDVDPLRPFFDRHVQPGSVLLEGGCGRATYVAHHAARAVRAIGLDFATETLANVRSRDASLLLGAADVARLPLRTGVVDTYYSGGVVEHFEGGPQDAIAEARRVLRRDGIFLVSVPYFNPLRRVMAPFRHTEWRRTRLHALESPPPDLVFFQYAYTPREFSQLVTQHGFRVLSRRGFAILWGLYEIPLLGRLLQRAANPAPTEVPSSRTVLRVHDGIGRTSVLKRLVVSEDDSVPLFGWAIRILRWLAANMMMYECAQAGETGT